LNIDAELESILTVTLKDLQFFFAEEKDQWKPFGTCSTPRCGHK
jgi:hypothetical protein